MNNNNKEDEELKEKLHTYVESIMQGKDGSDVGLDKDIEEAANKASSTVIQTLTGVVSTINLFLSPLVITIMWGWFLVPLGVPVIGYLTALGVSLLIGLFFDDSSASILITRATPIENLRVSLTRFTIVVTTLIFGFIISLFI